MEHHPSGVANDLQHEAHEHADSEPPCSLPDAQTQLGDDKDAEEDEEKQVGTEVGQVKEERLGNYVLISIVSMREDKPSLTAASFQGALVGRYGNVAVGKRVDSHGGFGI